MVTRKTAGIIGFVEIGEGEVGVVHRMAEILMGLSQFVTAHSGVMVPPAVLVGNLHLPDGGISN